MHWTKTRPKKSGWYWVENKHKNLSIVPYVIAKDDVPVAPYTVEAVKWAGPIPKPTEQLHGGLKND